MDKIQLHKRITFKFNDGWAGEDEWIHLGAAKVLQPRNHRFDGEYGTYTARVVVEYKLGDQDVSRSIEQTLSHGCRCEHDCCGHVSESAQVRRVSRREYFAQIFQTRNV
jgi:hypothetical protein